MRVLGLLILGDTGAIGGDEVRCAHAYTLLIIITVSYRCVDMDGATKELMKAREGNSGREGGR